MIQKLYQQLHDAAMLAWEISQTHSERIHRELAAKTYCVLKDEMEIMQPLMKAEQSSAELTALIKNYDAQLQQENPR